MPATPEWKTNGEAYRMNLNSPTEIAVFALCAIVAITFHEAAHGFVALHFGDSTAKNAGRVTLNPIKHIDLFGTIILPLLPYVSAGFIFGYAKPVPVNYSALKNPRRDMIWVAAAGVAMNGVIALLLWRSGRDVNVRSALLHEVGDTVSTAAVIVGGWAILLTGKSWIDPALSFGIGALILWSSFGIVRETLNILLEGTPRGMSLEDVEEAVRAIAGVSDVHDLHVWSIGSENHALSAHVKITDMPTSESDMILREINEKLGAGFGIHHTTIQLEHVVCETAHACVIAVAEERETERVHSEHEHGGHRR